MLERRSLESYLLNDVVLEALVADRNDRVGNAADRLKSARDGAIRSNGSAKGAISVVFGIAKNVLGNTEGLGENASQFSADVLAKLITSDMSVRKELEAVLDLP